MRYVDAEKLVRDIESVRQSLVCQGDPILASTLIPVIEHIKRSEDAIVRCKDCKNRAEPKCPMYHTEYRDDYFVEVQYYDEIEFDYTEEDGFCHLGAK